jgi:oligopeptide/dipeptide ABC transporter ATP-binding protein
LRHAGGAEDAAPDRGATRLLDVRDLRVSFRTEEGLVRAVDGVSFSLHQGEVLGIVGESGSGKTVTAQAIVGLNRGERNARFEGQVLYKGRDLLALSETALRHVRGAEIAMIFQDPMTSLNPVHRVGSQIGEMLAEHTSLSKAAIRRRVVELLAEVGIPRPETRVHDYPHQFSGGMRQRVMIAMALACNPSLLIADEPTTALDVTIQAQILRLIKRLKDVHGSAVIVITHDLGVIAEIADDVLVMYAGRGVEAGSLRDVFYDPQHPYTWGLLASIPTLDGPRSRRLPSIRGMPPSLIDLAPGCAFRPRCAHAFERCGELPPFEVRSGGERHHDRCWLPPEAKRRLRAGVAPGAERMPIG